MSGHRIMHIHHDTPRSLYTPSETSRTHPATHDRLGLKSKLSSVIRQEFHRVDDDPAPWVRALFEFELDLLDPVLFGGFLGGLAIDMDTVLVERVWEGFGDGEAGWESECRRVSVEKSGGDLLRGWAYAKT